MYQRNNFHLKLILLLLLVIFISCAVNPVTGKRELMLMSESEEIQLGKSSDAQIVSQYGVYPDKNLNEYVTAIGLRMAKLSHRPNLPFEFKIMDTPVINAFAIPGGYVYITRGILAYLNDEAELAGVMGHEIGHVTARHSAKQYSKAQLAQIGLGLGSVLSESFQKYAGIAQFGVGMLFLKFSRENESQADELGVEYSTKAGYDAREMANFFRTLDRMSPSENQSGLQEWFSTHPNPGGRSVKVKTLAQQWQQKVASKNLVIQRSEFLHHINGIVFGDDPRQGYVENNIFYHPDLTFLFSVPANWKLNNTPSQVQMLSPKEDAAILFSLGEGTSPEQAASKFISDSKATVVSQNNISVNSFPARKVISDITSQQGTMRVMSYFIRKGQNIYVFHGFTGQTTFSSFQPLFQSTMNSFRKLTDQKKINVKPDRIKVKTVRRRGTLKAILQRLNVPDEDLEKIALMNGMQLSDNVPANTLIKVVEKGR